MAEKDLHTRIITEIALSPEALAADTDGDAVDTQGFESVELVVNVGTAFVGGGFDITLEESATGAFAGEENVVADVDLVGAEGVGRAIEVLITDADETYRVGYIGKLRHVRAVFTETDTITAGVIGAVWVLGDPKVKATADKNT